MQWAKKAETPFKVSHQSGMVAPGVTFKMHISKLSGDSELPPTREADELTIFTEHQILRVAVSSRK